MKTHKDFKKLDFNELAFFAGISTVEAKWKIADHLEIKETTKQGAPKVGKNDLIPVEKYDFTMRSNSNLEGMSRLKYLCDYYNKGTDNNHLRDFAENETFAKALKFTGRFTVLNNILNPVQLQKVQKTWLLKKVHGQRFSDKKTEDFIKKNKWSGSFLKEKGFSVPAYATV